MITGTLDSGVVLLQNAKPHVRSLRPRPYSCITRWAFYCVGAFAALAIFDVPLIGLSITSPLFALVALPVLLTPAQPWIHRYLGWIILAAAIWFGIFASFLVNGPFSDRNQTDISHILPVVRFGYWLLVFVVTASFAANPRLLSRLPAVLAASITILACLRLFEAVVWGKIGTDSEPRFLTQNNYGGLFSTFSPFLLVLLVDRKWRRRVIGSVGLLMLWGAAAVNGSRGSWIGISVGLITFLSVVVLTTSRQVWRILLPLVFAAGLLTAGILASGRVGLTVIGRFATLEKLETDKSYMARQALNQKSRQLFQESPFFGIGPARYRDAYAFLDLPDVFSRAAESRINHQSAHNSYLLFLAETGLAASVPLGVLLLLFACKGLRATWKLAKDNQLWALGIFSSFAAMSVHFWAMAALTNTSAWFVYGLLVASIKVTKRIEYRHKPAVNVCSLKRKLGVGARPRQLAAFKAHAQS